MPTSPSNVLLGVGTALAIGAAAAIISQTPRKTSASSKKPKIPSTSETTEPSDRQLFIDDEIEFNDPNMQHLDRLQTTQDPTESPLLAIARDYRSYCQILSLQASDEGFKIFTSLSKEQTGQNNPIDEIDRSIPTSPTPQPTAKDHAGKTRLELLHSIGIISEKFMRQYVNNGVPFNKNEVTAAVTTNLRNSTTVKADATFALISKEDMFRIMTFGATQLIDITLLTKLKPAILPKEVIDSKLDRFMPVTVFMKILPTLMDAETVQIFESLWEMILQKSYPLNLEIAQIQDVFMGTFNQITQECLCQTITSTNDIHQDLFASTARNELHSLEIISKHLDKLNDQKVGGNIKQCFQKIAQLELQIKQQNTTINHNNSKNHQPQRSKLQTLLPSPLCQQIMH